MQAQINKIIFFDLYQTLIDVNIDNEKRRRDEEGWKIFAEILKNEYRTSIAPGEFLALYEKCRDDFYSTGRDMRIHHHNMLELVSAILKENRNFEKRKTQQS